MLYLAPLQRPIYACSSSHGVGCVGLDDGNTFEGTWEEMPTVSLWGGRMLTALLLIPIQQLDDAPCYRPNQ